MIYRTENFAEIHRESVQPLVDEAMRRWRDHERKTRIGLRRLVRLRQQAKRARKMGAKR